MRAGGGHAKGSEFERKTAKDIVKAFKKFGIEQRDCWRSVLSGGHFMSSGDLEMTPRMEELFPWSVECKFRKEIRWENFLLGNKKAEEVKWVQQAMDGAKKRINMRPLLVLKANHCKTLVLRESSVEDGPTLALLGKIWVVETWVTFLELAVATAKRKNEEKRMNLLK